MENNQQQILSEIKDMMASIRKQIEQLDLKMAELQQAVESRGSDTETVVLELDDLPFFDDAAPAVSVESEDLPEPAVPDLVPEFGTETEIVEPVLQHVVKKAVIDTMTDRQAWRKDIPGTAVRDVRSAISLNDRVLFINTLFGEDPVKFQDVLTQINQMPSLDEAVEYIAREYPKWDFESETVYRFMMAVRRKLN